MILALLTKAVGALENWLLAKLTEEYNAFTRVSKVKDWATLSFLIFNRWILSWTDFGSELSLRAEWGHASSSSSTLTLSCVVVRPWCIIWRHVKAPLADVKDGICHVMRAFEDDDVIHAEDTVDPAPYPNWIASRSIFVPRENWIHLVAVSIV